MKTFAVATTIHATPDRLWRILTDLATYPRWNPTVTKVDGQIAPGARIVVQVAINPGRAFPVTVSQLEPASRMVWSGGMPLGLFTGTRTFTLTPRDDGKTEFAMREEYRGLLAGLIGRSIPDLQPAFDEFAAALKREAER
jgi:hypothetical protein